MGLPSIVCLDSPSDLQETFFLVRSSVIDSCNLHTCAVVVRRVITASQADTAFDVVNV